MAKISDNYKKEAMNENNMGKIITIIGNNGVGKTTFANEICINPIFNKYVEDNKLRPYQVGFSNKKSNYALLNQVDFLLFRATQEKEIREKRILGVQDGGLDLDYWIFTQLFFMKGYLKEGDIDLCNRLYNFVRQLLQPPDIVVYLDAPIDILIKRRIIRARIIDIVDDNDLSSIDELIHNYVSNIDNKKLIYIDTSKETIGYEKSIKYVTNELIDRNIIVKST